MRKYCTRKLPLYFFVNLFGNYIPAIGFDFEFSFYLLLHIQGGSIIDETIVIPRAMPVQAQMPMGGVYGGFGAGGLGSQVGLGDEYGLRKFLGVFF
jgi:hypothetical protein